MSDARLLKHVYVSMSLWNKHDLVAILLRRKILRVRNSTAMANAFEFLKISCYLTRATAGRPCITARIIRSPMEVNR